MGVTLDEFHIIVDHIKSYTNEGNSPTRKACHTHYPIYSEIYELLDILMGKSHIHYGCVNSDFEDQIISDSTQLWSALFHLAHSKCKKL